MGKGITYRPARKQDAAVIGQCWMALMHDHEALDHRFVLSEDALTRWENDFPHWLEDSARKIEVAVHGDEVIGFVQAHRRIEPPIFEEIPEIYIDEIFVAPQHRGRGTGEGLLQTIRDWARGLGVCRLRFRVLTSNDGAIAFWERSGATPHAVTYTIELEGAPAEKKQPALKRIGF